MRIGDLFLQEFLNDGNCSGIAGRADNFRFFVLRIFRMIASSKAEKVASFKKAEQSKSALQGAKKMQYRKMRMDR